MADHEHTASLMTPAKLAQVRPQGQVSPAAWLDQMAADAGHQHVRRLAELRVELEERSARRNFAPITAALVSLGEVLPRLDFGLLQSRGWWARTTGKARAAAGQFAKSFESIDEAATALVNQIQALQKSQAEPGGAGERGWMEFEVEFRAIEKIIDQGARWLQDMRNQLKAREATVSDDASRQSIKDDTGRCEILVDRLKALRAVCSAGQAAHQQAQEAAKRRAAFAQVLQAGAAQVKTWQNRLGAVAAAAGEDSSAALSVEAAMESHRELQLWVKRVGADCAQLQSQEDTATQNLGAMVPLLAAAR